MINDFVQMIKDFISKGCIDDISNLEDSFCGQCSELPDIHGACTD